MNRPVWISTLVDESGYSTQALHSTAGGPWRMCLANVCNLMSQGGVLKSA